jgi:hypothetical protein
MNEVIQTHAYSDDLCLHEDHNLVQLTDMRLA